MHGCSMLMDLPLAVLTACLLYALLHWPCTSTLTLLGLLAFKGSPLVPSPGSRTCTSYSPDMLTSMFVSSRLPNWSGVGYFTSVAIKHMLHTNFKMQLWHIITIHDCIQQTKTLTSTVSYPMQSPLKQRTHSIHTYLHICTHTHTHAHTYTHMHAHMHAHTHTHTCTFAHAACPVSIVMYIYCLLQSVAMCIQYVLNRLNFTRNMSCLLHLFTSFCILHTILI